MNVRSPRTLAAWTAAGAAGVLLTAGALQAGAATPAPSTSTGSTGSTVTAEPDAGEDERRGGPGRHGLRDALHGEFTTGSADDGYVTVVVTRGVASDVSATSLTVTSEDGFRQTYAVDADTTVRVDGEEAAVTDVAEGETVRVSGEQNDGTVTADRIGAGDPPAREGRGGPGEHGEHGGPGGHRGGPGQAPAAEVDPGTDSGATVEGSSLPTA